ncbi:hypothetical protein OUZ56_016229 [Daphnia magna]|uniref:Uncharacterized protein n=1 Tax=Daphnia magna TaxID=35525 RepID=A0ABR0AQ15_9CRUS|nr:hypothetical protein OUZ56_016229 [Daphnia magna]
MQICNLGAEFAFDSSLDVCIALLFFFLDIATSLLHLAYNGNRLSRFSGCHHSFNANYKL